MKVQNCGSCGEYKYIESDGMCRDCYKSEKNGYNTSIINKCKKEKESNIPLDRFNSNNNNIILGSFNTSTTIMTGLEMLRLKRKYNDLKVYCVDKSGVLNKFIQLISGSIVTVGNQFNINSLNLNGKENVCFDYTNLTKNTIDHLAKLLMKICKKDRKKTAVYINLHNDLDRSYANKINKLLTRSRSYKTSINTISSTFPPDKMQYSSPITRIHKIGNPMLSNKLKSIISKKDRDYICNNSISYQSTNSPNVLIRDKKNKGYRRTKFNISKQEQKILNKI